MGDGYRENSGLADKKTRDGKLMTGKQEDLKTVQVGRKEGNEVKCEQVQGDILNKMGALGECPQHAALAKSLCSRHHQEQ